MYRDIFKPTDKYKVYKFYMINFYIVFLTTLCKVYKICSWNKKTTVIF